jgi:hypothetical protein
MEAGTPQPSVERPNGPVAAALLAVGIGSLVLAIMVVAASSSESFAQSLAYSDRVGPLAGKTIWSVVAYVVSWAGLGVALRRREVPLDKVAIVTGILIALALVGTFAPFFEMFAPEE